MMGQLTPREVEEILESEALGRIAFIVDGKARIVPVTYVYDGESAYLHSAEGEKLRAMRANPDVCFEVEQVRDMANWRSVVARGRFEELWHDEGERAMDLLVARLTPGPESHPDRREDAHRREGLLRPVLYRLHLTEKRGRFERA
jgi:uncharacterized protein